MCAVIASLLRLNAASPLQIAQEAYVKASNTGGSATQGGDNFGFAVAVSGNTVVVGAPAESSDAVGVNGDQTNNAAFGAGAAYVFVRAGDRWVQQAYLKASNTERSAAFGRSVAVSGDTIVIGAPFEGSAAPLSGAACVFVRVNTNWFQQAHLKASNAGTNDNFGIAVAIAGDTLVVGASQEDGNSRLINGDQSNDGAPNAGAAYVFLRSGSNWTQNAYLKASNSDPLDGFGISVSVSLGYEETVVVGALGEDSNGVGASGNQDDNSAVDSGAIYVFVRPGGSNWVQQAYLKASNSGFADHFGEVIAVADNTLIAGAQYEDSNATGINGDGSNNDSPNSGAAYVFTRSETNWMQQAYLKASNTGAQDKFGRAVAVWNRIAVVGANEEGSSAAGVNHPTGQTNNSAPRAGAAYVFQQEGTNWTQQAYLKASNPGGGQHPSDFGDYFGYAVAIFGGTVVIGAPYERSDATGINGDQNNNNAQGAGAAYIFASGAVPRSFFSTPVNPGDSIDLTDTSWHIATFVIGNRGTNDLQITSIGFLSPSASIEVAVTNRSGAPASFPHTIPAGGTNEMLEVTVTWHRDTAARYTLLIATDDPALPVAEYTINCRIIDLREERDETTFIDWFVIALSTGQLKGLNDPTNAPDPATTRRARLDLDTNSAMRVTTEIPAFLGGGSVELSNFTGSAVISLSPIPNDTNRLFLRVESGSFTAPSFLLPSGLESGPNRLTFDHPEQSRGIFFLSNGHYTAHARATIVNNLVPDGVMVSGNYSGIYNPATGKASLQSDSTDLFEESGTVLLNHATNGWWLTWASTNVMEEATNIGGPWRPLTNAVSPYAVITTNLPQQFFRLRQPEP